MATNVTPQPAHPRATALARIRAAKSAWGPGASLAAIREGFETLLCPENDIPATDLNLAGIPAMAIGGDGNWLRPSVLFFHGGGFQVGSLQSHRGLMRDIARASGVPVIGIEYRLAPEHRFPAAADDCRAAFDSLVERGVAPHDIVLAGDSAGGHLALGLALDLKDDGRSPAGLVLISPWLDLSLSGGSYISRAALDVFSQPAQLRAMAKTYLGRDRQLTDPRIDLLSRNLTGLPPVLIHAGDHDITLDDAKTLANAATRATASHHLAIWPEMMHHFQMFADLPESIESLAAIGAFVRACLARDHQLSRLNEHDLF